MLKTKNNKNAPKKLESTYTSVVSTDKNSSTSTDSDLPPIVRNRKGLLPPPNKGKKAPIAKKVKMPKDSQPARPPPPKFTPHNSGPPAKNCGNQSNTLQRLQAAEAEMERLRLELWKEGEKRAMAEEKQQMDTLGAKYESHVRQWEAAQAECEKDRKRRKAILKYIVQKRKEKKWAREEAKKWRHHHRQMSIEENERMAQEFQENEEERFMELMKMYTEQEDKLLDAQMETRSTKNMKAPELEELRRMFAPVARGPNEMFEYYILEPQPTDAMMKRQAEQKVAAMLGLRNSHGIHLNLSDRFKKKTTIQLAMGPKCLNGERDQFCNVIRHPGALCTEKTSSPSTTSLPHVPIPNCLKPLMKTLPYRVEQMDAPLLKMESFGPGPNFDGARLYGTIVIPKGQTLEPYYTDPYSVTF